MINQGDCAEKSKLAYTDKLTKEIANQLRANHAYFSSLDKIIVYYDYGQVELAQILVFHSKNDFKKNIYNNIARKRLESKRNVRINSEYEERMYMHKITELRGWERLLKKIIWAQLGEIKGKNVLDFGSGEGITANHFAKDNNVVAVEPWDEMLKHRWKDYEYRQIQGDVSKLSEFEDNTFDVIICHNVLEYIDDKAQIINELHRVLKPGGTLSIAKHNRAGRVMQMAVLFDDIEKANELLDGKDSAASKFGAIRYYEDQMVSEWNAGLKCVDCFGIRTFWDLQQNQEKHDLEEWQDKMMQLEMRVAQIDEYRKIAFFHHLLFTKEE